MYDGMRVLEATADNMYQSGQFEAVQRGVRLLVQLVMQRSQLLLVSLDHLLLVLGSTSRS